MSVYCRKLFGFIFVCIFALIFSPGQLCVIHGDDSRVYASENESVDLVCLDISQGSIYISDNGYRVGDNTEIVPFQGVYKIIGQTQKEYGIKILNGEHTVILDNVDIDQRTLRGCYPLNVEKDSILHLYMRGENALFAGSGYSGITLGQGAKVELQGFGQGTLHLLANPDKINDSLLGASAISIADKSIVSYFSQKKSCDEFIMYAGTNRLSICKVQEYNNEPYLKIQYNVEHDCHMLSAPADCTRGQYCLECGREVAPESQHTPGPEATCTQAQICQICGEVLKEPLGHQGVWKEETGVGNGKAFRREKMICTVCGEVLVRNCDAGE